jgi:hypothetical protein
VSGLLNQEAGEQQRTNNAIGTEENKMNLLRCLLAEPQSGGQNRLTALGGTATVRRDDGGNFSVRMHVNFAKCEIDFEQLLHCVGSNRIAFLISPEIAL